MKKIQSLILCATILTSVAMANPNAVVNLDAHYDKNNTLVAPDLFLIAMAVKAYEDGFNQSAYTKFKQAAAFGNTIAFRYLGLMNIKALSVKQDWAKGYAWIRLAEKDMYYTGGTIIIDHGYGLTTTYLHMSQLNVEVGQYVEQTEKIGEIGATGRATGPHLDWRLNLGKTRLDPQLIIPDVATSFRQE
jgi:hypothetical protein